MGCEELVQHLENDPMNTYYLTGDNKQGAYYINNSGTWDTQENSKKRIITFAEYMDMINNQEHTINSGTWYVRGCVELSRFIKSDPRNRTSLQGSISNYIYYLTEKNEWEVNFRSPDGSKTEISFEQFLNLDKNNKMNTEPQRLTIRRLKELYTKFNCDDWRESIRAILKDNLLIHDNELVDIPNKYIKRLAEDGSKEQKLASGLSFEEDKSVDLTKLSTADCYGFNGAISIRVVNEYAGKSFFLNRNYNWEIKPDSAGDLCLIPTKK